MSDYTLNGFSMNANGILAGQEQGGNLAVSGWWDMPSRIGKIFHDWPEENSVEPYLRSDEIFFGGRAITMRAVVLTNSRSEALDVIETFAEQADSITGPVSLVSDWGTRNVVVDGQCSVDRIWKGNAYVSIPFREPVVTIDGLLPESKSGGFGIDGYSWADLGLIKLQTHEELSRPAPKKLETMVYGKESIRVSKRGFREIKLRLFVRGGTYSAFESTIGNFAYLLSQSGKRVLRLEDGSYREVFAKDGFQVSGVVKNMDEVYGFIDVTLCEIRIVEQYKVLETNGRQFANKHGQRLAWVIKST